MVGAAGQAVAADPHARAAAISRTRAVVDMASTIIPSMLLALPHERRDPHRNVGGGDQGRSRRIVGESTPLCKIILPDTARVVEPYFSPTSPPEEKREDHLVVVPFTSFCNWGSVFGLVGATGPPALTSFAQLRLTTHIVVQLGLKGAQKGPKYCATQAHGSVCTIAQLRLTSGWPDHATEAQKTRN